MGRRDATAASTSGAWFTSRRARIRVEAIVAAVSLFILVGPLTLAWDRAPEPLLAVIGIPAAIGLVLSLIVLTREIVPRAGEDEEEDESEKAVARLVSGKGIDPPRAGPGEPRGD